VEFYKVGAPCEQKRAAFPSCAGTLAGSPKKRLFELIGDLVDAGLGATTSSLSPAAGPHTGKKRPTAADRLFGRALIGRAPRAGIMLPSRSAPAWVSWRRFSANSPEGQAGSHARSKALAAIGVLPWYCGPVIVRAQRHPALQPHIADDVH